MSQLLDAAAGMPNACEPIPGMVTGGQPTLDQLVALKRAGCAVVLDIRDPMEQQPFEPGDAVRGAGLEYINIPVSGATQTDATLERVRDAVRALVGSKPFLFYCRSGNRVGATLIPYLMLDRGYGEDQAVTEAMRIGTRSPELIEWALDYVQRRAEESA